MFSNVLNLICFDDIIWSYFRVTSSPKVHSVFSNTIRASLLSFSEQNTLYRLQIEMQILISMYIITYTYFIFFIFTSPILFSVHVYFF